MVFFPGGLRPGSFVPGGSVPPLTKRAVSDLGV